MIRTGADNVLRSAVILFPAVTTSEPLSEVTFISDPASSCLSSAALTVTTEGASARATSASCSGSTEATPSGRSPESLSASSVLSFSSRFT